MELLWYSFDIIGTIAFAISGALIGVARRLDIFGMLILAMTTAIGGGITRDILVGQIPPTSMKSPIYIIIIIACTLLVFIVFSRHYQDRVIGKWSRRIYFFADAVGLASFTVTGASVGYGYFPDLPIFCVLLGAVTAVGGGIIRDILGHRMPSVLKEDVYATPSIIGGTFYYFLLDHQFNAFHASWVSFLVVLIIREMALKYNWNLPKVR